MAHKLLHVVAHSYAEAFDHGGLERAQIEDWFKDLDDPTQWSVHITDEDGNLAGVKKEGGHIIIWKIPPPPA